MRDIPGVDGYLSREACAFNTAIWVGLGVGNSTSKAFHSRYSERTNLIQFHILSDVSPWTNTIWKCCTKFPRTTDESM